MKPLSDMILLDDMEGKAIRSHSHEFRNIFDPSGDKSREIVNLAGRIQGEVSGEMRRLVGDFKNRCGFLLISELVDYLKGYDKLNLPEPTDITRPRYIVAGKDRKKNRLEEILRERYNIHVVTEIPSDAEFVVLVNPEDVGNWKGQELLYLPLPHMEQSLKLAAGMLLSDKEIARNYLKGFYSILLGRELSDEEVSNLFRKPWWILPEISRLTTDLSILHDVISLLEKSA